VSVPVCVVDASVGVKWFRNEPGSSEARELLARHIGGELALAVDSLFLHEVLRVASRDAHAEDAVRVWADLAALDPAVAPLLEAVREALIQVDEVGRDVRKYRDAVFHDPDRLAAVEARLDLIAGLKRKYGRSVTEILEFGRKAREELRRLENSAEIVAELEARASRQRAALEVAAAELTALRREVAGRLEEAIEASLAELEMKGTRFVVGLEPVQPPTAAGAERVEFLFSPNPGEPPKPLARIASGGEMSRVMLALKAVLAETDAIPTMIFDEIDTGVGGGAAQAVAEKLATIALARQVICVTHLPRIAAMADAHHYIMKESAGGRTGTRVKTLSPAEREHEVARMLAGHPPTPITLAHAREMLEQGERAKRALRASRLEVAASGAGGPQSEKA